MFPESHGFVGMPVIVGMPVTSCIKDTCLNLSLSKGDEIVPQPCDRHSNETATLGKHVTKYKNMQKWMVEFLRIFEDRGFNIVRVKSILINKSINLQLFTLILCSVGGPLLC